jgi:hypothetical protein
MPNWCENQLEIKGNLDDLKQFEVENFDEEGLKFAKSCPVPEELGEWDYEWCCENWGTKWEPDFYMDYDDNDNEWNFNTAWGPPNKWLESVAAKYPSISFTLKYAEGGCDFSGIMQFVDGECVCNEEGSNGDYYGENYCKACDEYIQWEDKDDFWDNDLCICFNCRDDAFQTISNVIRSKKIEQLPKKLACMKIGRNSIMDNYLMRKVFLPRLCDCIN